MIGDSRSRHEPLSTLAIDTPVLRRSRPIRAPDGQSTAPKRQVAAAQAQPRSSLYRIIWRWHFYAGLIVSPVLIVVAATGGLYIFRAELERMMYSQLMFVADSPRQVTYEDQLAAVRSAGPPGFRVQRMMLSDDPSRATEFFLAGEPGQFSTTFVDQHTGKVLGNRGANGFFDVVLRIHRSLFVGTTGRIIVELTTCWTIVLLVTGVYLWWPARRRKFWGAWLPRLRGNPYKVLRDLHAVGGAYLAPIAMLIALTGLLYTYVWGSGYFLAASKTGDLATLLQPPKSTSPSDMPTLPLDAVVKIARTHCADGNLSIQPPATSEDAFSCYFFGDDRPVEYTRLVVDRASGEVLLARRTADLPALAWWSRWNYPLHVGSILGIATKVLWLVTCVVLIGLPFTGLWMWWKRRPRGASGFPRRVEMRAPRKIVLVILGLGAFLPAVGASIVLILLGEAVVQRLTRPGRIGA